MIIEAKISVKKMSDTADQERFDKLRQYVDGLGFTKAQKSEFLMKEWDRICKENKPNEQRERGKPRGRWKKRNY